jgi:hypothetical protein
LKRGSAAYVEAVTGPQLLFGPDIVDVEAVHMMPYLLI